jgi:hypothetical protein
MSNTELNFNSSEQDVDKAIGEMTSSPPESSFYAGSIGARKLPATGGAVGTLGTTREREETRADLAFKLFGSAIDFDNITVRDNYFVDERGLLLTELSGDPLAAEKPTEMGVAAWLIDDEGRVHFLTRPSSGAATVDDLDQAADQAKRLVEDDAKKRREWLRSQPQRPLTIGDVDGREHQTLRAAVRTVLDAGGTVGVGDYGEVNVTIPELFIYNRNSVTVGMEEMAAREACATAALTIAKAERVVLKALATQKKGQRLDMLVPDAPVTISGGVA